MLRRITPTAERTVTRGGDKKPLTNETRLENGSRDACAAVIAGPRVGEHLTSHHGRPERVVEFAIREQTGIGRDDGSAKLKHQSAVDKRA